MTAVGGVGYADVLIRLADKLETTTRGGLGYPTPGVVAQVLDNRIVQTPALELIDDLTAPDRRGHHHPPHSVRASAGGKVAADLPRVPDLDVPAEPGPAPRRSQL
jgi:hypothetical protein